MKISYTQPSDYIEPLNINGLDGRVLHLPAPADKPAVEILFVYGHHSSLERWWGLMQVLNHYGAVTMPDLPGFGGMDSLYEIGKKPSIDNLADYLATFIKLRYKSQPFVIAGMSFGFVVATRMLQRYPELSKQVTLMISVVGFAHHDDFTLSKSRYNFYLWTARVMSHRLPALFFRYVCLNSVVLRAVYAHTNNAKFKQVSSPEEFNYLMDIEIGLWRDNDVRTYMYTTTQFLKVDNCSKRVNVPIWHISTSADHFFDHRIVEQHLQLIYKDYHSAEANLQSHAPSVLADEKMAAPMVPPALRKVLSRLK